MTALLELSNWIVLTKDKEDDADIVAVVVVLRPQLLLEVLSYAHSFWGSRPL